MRRIPFKVCVAVGILALLFILSGYLLELLVWSTVGAAKTYKMIEPSLFPKVDIRDIYHENQVAYLFLNNLTRTDRVTVKSSSLPNVGK